MRYKGIAYPLVRHPEGVFHNSATDVGQIKSSLAAIILTEPGDRIFMPFFGTPLSKINLNSPREIVIGEVRLKVAAAIKKWEKRIQVHDVMIDLASTEDDKLVVKVNVLFLDPINVNNVESLIVYKSLGGVDGRNMPF
jgi:phage baseplate assembly protein W